MVKTIVLDTNVFLTESQALFAFGEDNVAIPTIVLDEIDKHKHRQDTAGHNARSMNRLLDSLRTKGSLLVGVTLGQNKGKVFAAQYDPRYMPVGMDTTDSDNKIIAIALRLKLEGHDVAVVSRDLNMRVKCDSFGLPCEDYQPQKVISSVDSLFDGTQELTVTDELLEDFYSDTPTYLPEQQVKLYPNQYLVLQSEKNKKKSALCRFKHPEKPLQKVSAYRDIWGLSANNKEQIFKIVA